MDEKERQEIKQAIKKLQEMYLESFSRDKQLLQLVDKLAERVLRVEDILDKMNQL